jgi:hypothetical protein
MVAKKDFRGMTWEIAFPLDWRVVIHHISDGPLYVNGINFTVLPEGAAPYREKQVRLITKECWKHFLRNHPDVPWFLRGFFDMYVNLTNLCKMIDELNQQYHPMEEWVSRYGCAFHMGIDYPHGSTGHLFSNKAVRTLVESIPIFDDCPPKDAEDLCVRFTMDKLNIPFYSGCSRYFATGFPDASVSTIQSMIDNARPCPDYGMMSIHSLAKLRPCPITKAVTIHMHAVRMDKWTEYLHRASSLSLVWTNPDVNSLWVDFCKPPLCDCPCE